MCIRFTPFGISYWVEGSWVLDVMLSLIDTVMFLLRSRFWDFPGLLSVCFGIAALGSSSWIALGSSGELGI